MRQLEKDERGFVSLFTVIFFMLLITIITVGFLRLMAAEQRQALSSAHALVSAQQLLSLQVLQVASANESPHAG